MSTIIPQADARVQLQGIVWDDYVRLRELPESRHVRMTFDQGVLELMSPSKLHERLAELLGRLILVWTEERSIPLQSCGSMTFQREDLSRALEPDKCYYIQHEAQVREREELDVTVDPPPDLVVEVDITSPSRDRLPIYAALDVPEVWLWRRGLLEVLLVDENGSYVGGNTSRALPGFLIDEVCRLLEARRNLDETALVREFRAAVS